MSVTGDGVGVVAHAGSVGLRLLADRVGLTTELSKAMVRRWFTPVHDRGRVLVDFAVMILTWLTISGPGWLRGCDLRVR